MRVKYQIPTFIAALLFCVASLTGTAWAQGGFAPVVTVNNAAVTEWELAQRQQFLRLLRAPEEVVAKAEDALIEDRLRTTAARDLKITLTDAQIEAGMEEFAQRANLSAEEFIKAIGQGGIARETFRDFVSAGLVWREVVRGKFAGRVTISEAEIDRALSLTSQRGSGARVLVSEIVIPSSSGVQQARALATQLSESIKSEVEFAQAARQYSAAPSRAAGGRLGWIPLSNLPAAVRPVILGLRPGQITPPVPLSNGVALFQLRALTDGGAVQPQNISVDYAQFLIPGGQTAAAQAEAARVRGEVDTCDDLYTAARGLPPEQLLRETRPLSQVPGDIAAELARLDEGESSTTLVRGNALVFLMLCKRTATLALDPVIPLADAALDRAEGVPATSPDLSFGTGPSRDQVRTELLNQRLAGLADGYMAELRANAIIRRP
jgi:peptidyl-prolyl cis-trans isomerase SurA